MISRTAILVALLPVLGACVAADAGLSRADQAEIRRYVPAAHLDNLTPQEVTQLQQALHHGDGFDTGYAIESILANRSAD